MTSGVATEHGFRAYLPLRKEERSGFALCFSGGGYRAALFHLGALRRLNELGLVSSADTITSVSGGSIMTAQLASHRRALGDRWPAPGEPVPGWEEGVAAPLRAFTRTNIRTRPILSRLIPRNWLNSNAAVEGLQARYAAGPARGPLTELPQHPRFVFCATDITFRTQWVFDAGKRVVGDEAAGFQAADGWPLARAAAASSCLPGAFTAMKVDLDGLRDHVELTDGGIYDNLGLEPVWRDHAVVLVSDGAPSFTPDPDMPALIWRGLRYAVTLLEQATDVRKRWLISNFILGELEGTYWGIGSLPSSYDAEAGYPDALIAEVISQVRIDLDVFSEGEIAVLENHGYFMADIAVGRHALDLVAGPPAPARAPHQDWLEEGKVRRALAGSHKTKLFARGW